VGFAVSQTLIPEVLAGRGGVSQAALPLADERVLRDLWESRFGSILIEVRGNEVFVNEQLVERHTEPA
jgi:hypothetical protein